MPGDDKSIADFTAPFLEAFGGITRTPVDWEAASLDYVSDARKRDAAARYRAKIEEMPEFAATDWTRPKFDQNRAAIAKVLGWQFGKTGLLLSGPTGRGKTRSLMDLFKRLACEDGQEVRYWYAGDWFAHLGTQLNYGRDDARGWVEAIAARPLVILDDLGQEAIQTSKQDWAQAWFFRFLDLRIAKGLPLIVTTNLSAQDMAGRATQLRSDPLVRRLTELCEVVKFA